jgi:hypothetical protein
VWCTRRRGSRGSPSGERPTNSIPDVTTHASSRPLVSYLTLTISSPPLPHSVSSLLYPSQILGSSIPPSNVSSLPPSPHSTSTSSSPVSSVYIPPPFLVTHSRCPHLLLWSIHLALSCPAVLWSICPAMYCSALVYLSSPALYCFGQDRTGHDSRELDS